MQTNLIAELARLNELDKKRTQGQWVAGCHPALPQYCIINPITLGNRIEKLPECEGGGAYFKNKADGELCAAAPDAVALANQLHARIAELEAQVAELQKPEWWNDEDGETGGRPPEDVAFLKVGGIVKAYGARQVAVKYVASIAISYDDEGDLEDYDYVVFDTLEAAKAAVAAMPKPPTKE